MTSLLALFRDLERDLARLRAALDSRERSCGCPHPARFHDGRGCHFGWADWRCPCLVGRVARS